MRRRRKKQNTGCVTGNGLFEINIAPLIFSVEFIYYHEMTRYYMPFCVRFALLYFSLIPNSTACRRAERVGLLTMASLTLSTFSGVRAVATGPGGFFFIIVPLVRKDVTHLKMVIATWNVPMTPDIETATKEPLSFNNRFTTIYETVVCKHTML